MILTKIEMARYIVQVLDERTDLPSAEDSKVVKLSRGNTYERLSFQYKLAMAILGPNKEMSLYKLVKFCTN